MIFCPNKNLPEWKELVDRLGDEDLAYFEWNRKYGDFNQVPVKTIKDGVPELFDSNPELGNIGTPEQYSQYLDTIFPDSKVKDIVYRGDKSKSVNGVKEFLEGRRKRMLYLSTSKDVASNKLYWEDWTEFGGGKNFITAIVNIQAPYELDVKSQRYDEYEIDGKIEQNFEKEAREDKSKDSFIVRNVKEAGGIVSNTVAIKKPEQIHILGSQKDIKGFKEFADKVNETDVALEHQEVFTMEELSSMMYENTELDFNTEELVESPIDKLYNDYIEIFSENQISKDKLEELLSKGVSVNSIEEWTKSCLIGGGKGVPKAKDGMSFNFTPGGKWKLIKDLQGYPTHEKGGVDLYIGKNGVSMASGESSLIAEKGLVLPYNVKDYV